MPVWNARFTRIQTTPILLSRSNNIRVVCNWKDVQKIVRRESETQTYDSWLEVVPAPVLMSLKGGADRSSEI